ncbi:MAG: hypothetical protein JW827_03450 [Spirochaetes bacterium]|nr:hypothetical protein [Spirochaetota bacterium]
MSKQLFSQIMIFLSTVLLILMFFFPTFTAFRKVVLGRIDVITLLLVIGLYVKDFLHPSH